MSKEAMKLALEALEWSDCNDDDGLEAATNKAINALREALAEQPANQLDDINVVDIPAQQEPSDLDVWKARALQAEAVIEKFMAKQPAQPGQEPVLQEIEQYRLQMAGICTAAIGYWKEGDGIHPDYDTVALRDVAKLYAKYDELYRAQPAQQEPTAWRYLTHYKNQSVWTYCAFEPTSRMRWEALYTSPSNRTWVGLVWGELPEDGHDHDFLRGATWAEAKLKEKNT